MKRLAISWVAVGALCLGSTACAHGQETAQAILAVSVDEIAHEYAQAKGSRLAYCEATSDTMLQARQCMGPYYGDRGTQLLEIIVAAQKSLAEGLEALRELQQLIEQENEREKSR